MEGAADYGTMFLHPQEKMENLVPVLFRQCERKRDHCGPDVAAVCIHTYFPCFMQVSLQRAHPGAGPCSSVPAGCLFYPSFL